MATTYTGGCLCGAVRWAVDGEPKFVAHCHCSQCRRAHGAPLVTYAGFREEQFAVTAGPEHLKAFNSETGATRSFCSQCGSTLLFASPRWAGEVHVSLVSFDESRNLKPRGHFYVDHGASWFPITDDLPQYGGEDGASPKETS